MKLLTKKNNFLFLVMLTFIFVSSTALAVTGQLSKFVEALPKIVKAEKHFPEIPILSPTSSFPTFSAQGVMAVDLTSGISLYEKNTDNPLLPASTTKIVTALVALDTYPLDSVLTVGKVKVEGQKMGLFAGEQMKVEDLLYGLLVYSSNDAAEVFAQNYVGGRDAFIMAMNAKAKELSMNNSYFDNPVGLDGISQMTTAKDLVRVSEVAMRNPEFAKIVGTKEIVVHDVTGKYSHSLKNINQLLGSVPGVLGVKTGWTENARENLVTYIERDNHKIMIVVLGSSDRFGETKELIDWIFGNYKWEEVIVRNNPQ
ncbi:MAG TPA: D-alanyl-D-alanine carboxypeptidase family protein [Alphaproteobacteria bacterium]|jgi:D-alanyl-D-alanine carboxypeptidase|nr:D-alanyl-D-alanine carboxypeptidase family protein [Alphaproteobacteria bacterium]